MTFMRHLLTATAFAGLLAFGSVQAANAADPIPYPGSGSYNPITYSFTAAADGDVIAYLVGGNGAGFSNELSVLINGVLSPNGFGLENHSAYGTSFNLGTAVAGDVLTFVMRNNSLGKFAYSDPSLNVPYDDPGVTEHNHIYSTNYTATDPVFPGVPAGTYVAFEDIPFPGADFNYDDESFVFSNVRVSTVPEPGTVGLLVGMSVPFAAFALRRRSIGSPGYRL